MNWKHKRNELPVGSEEPNLFIIALGVPKVGRYNARKQRFEEWTLDMFESMGWVSISFVTYWQYIELPDDYMNKED